MLFRLTFKFSVSKPILQVRFKSEQVFSCVLQEIYYYRHNYDLGANVV
jgi:hypothetical protein